MTLDNALVLVLCLAALAHVVSGAACTPHYIVPPMTCDPLTDPGCTCVLPYDAPFDPQNPTGACPACPNTPPSCPQLEANARPGHRFVCRSFADVDVDDDSDGESWEMVEQREDVVLRAGEFTPSPDTCCSCNVTLCQARKQSLDTYHSSFSLFDGIDPNNSTAIHAAYVKFVDALTEVFTPDSNMTAIGIGIFQPRTVNIEYQLIVTPFAGNQSNSQYQHDYNAQWWDNGRSYVANGCARVRFNIENFAKQTMIGYGQYENFTFEDGTARIHLISLTPACAFIQPPLPPQLDQITQICNAMQGICINTTNYEFKDDVQGCINYWSKLALKQTAIVKGQCKFAYSGIADTTGCRQIHYLSAIVDPSVHCAHTNSTSDMCYDRMWDNPGPDCPYYHPRPE